MAIDVRLPSPRARRSDVRVGAVVAVAIAVAFVVWLLVRSSDSNTPSKAGTVAASGPLETTADKLRRLSDELGHPIYWAGPVPDRTYELTRTWANHLGPGRARPLAAGPGRRLARLSAPAGGALARLWKAVGGREWRTAAAGARAARGADRRHPRSRIRHPRGCDRGAGGAARDRARRRGVDAETALA